MLKEVCAKLVAAVAGPVVTWWLNLSRKGAATPVETVVIEETETTTIRRTTRRRTVRDAGRKRRDKEKPAGQRPAGG